MERLKELLEELKPGVDFEECENLVDGHILDSLTILSLIASLEEEFDITIPTIEIIPDNFNSISKIWNLITKLQDEE